MIRLILLFILLPLNAYAFKVGTYTAPPFSMYEDGAYLGLATEAVQALLKDAGLSEYETINYPLARAVVELEAGRIDLLYPYINGSAKLGEKILLIGPIARYQVAWFVRKDYPQEVSLATMKNLNVGAERASIAYKFLLDNHMQIEQTTQELSCLSMVVAQRLNACATGMLPGMYCAAINTIYDKIRFVPTDFYADVYLALAPSLAPDSIAKITAAYQRLKNSNYFVKQQQEYEKKFAIFIESLA